MLQQKQQGNCCTDQNSGLNGTASRASDNIIVVVGFEDLAAGPLHATQRKPIIVEQVQEVARKLGGGGLDRVELLISDKHTRQYY
jgi:hypothetical protein